MTVKAGDPTHIVLKLPTGSLESAHPCSEGTLSEIFMFSWHCLLSFAEATFQRVLALIIPSKFQKAREQVTAQELDYWAALLRFPG